MKSTVYLIVEASRKYGRQMPDYDGLREVTGTRIVGHRLKRPASLAKDQVAVRVTLDVPNEIFDPISPMATVTIPSDLALRRPVEVEAVDANEPDEDEA